MLDEKAPFFRVEQPRGPVVDSKGLEFKFRQGVLFAPRGLASAVLGEGRQRDVPGLGLAPVISPRLGYDGGPGGAHGVSHAASHVKARRCDRRRPPPSPASASGSAEVFSRAKPPGLLDWIRLITKAKLLCVTQMLGYVFSFRCLAQERVTFVVRLWGFVGQSKLFLFLRN